MGRIKDFVKKIIGIEILKEEIRDLEIENTELREINAQNVTTIEKLSQLLNQLSCRVSELSQTDDKIKDNLVKTMYCLEKQIIAEPPGVYKGQREKRIIVSITSYPGRIQVVGSVIERMLIQTVRPDKVILCLSKDQFPNLESDLPDALLELKKYGLDILWCDGDIKAYKKTLPALKLFPDDLLIIFDDDLVYRSDLVEELYLAHLKHPKAVIASRVHQVRRSENGDILPYCHWKKECTFDIGIEKNDWFFTGGAGTLFPPNIFNQEVFNESVFAELCPYADDIWLNLHVAMQKVPIVNVAANNYIIYIPGTQEDRLYNVNKEKNDEQLKNLIEYYKKELLGTIYAM